MRAIVRRVLAIVCWLAAVFFVGALVASPPMDLTPTVMIVFGGMMAACGAYTLSGGRSSRDEQRRNYARLASNDATRASITSVSSLPSARGMPISDVPEATIWLHALSIILTLAIVMMLII